MANNIGSVIAKNKIKPIKEPIARYFIKNIVLNN